MSLPGDQAVSVLRKEHNGDEAELQSMLTLAFLTLPNTFWPSSLILNTAEPIKLIIVRNIR